VAAKKRSRETKKQRRRRVIRNRICLALIVIALILIVVLIVVFAGRVKKENNGGETASTTVPVSTESIEAYTGTSSDTDLAETDSAETEEEPNRPGRINDTLPPVITGESDVYVSIGSRVKYKSYVYVTDDYDFEPALDIDNSQVDLSSVGTYEVIYTATDASGNSSSRTITIHVTETESPDVPESEIIEMADSILDNIIEDDMTDLEKVFAVFYHVRDTYSYIPDENHWDYMQEAYHLMTERQDSCFANVCLSKLLLERLGFESYMAEGDLGYMAEKHYWNMVSIDHGNSWYMYDSAWWTWMHEELPLCMITNDQAQVISDAHGGLWIFDHSKYDSTPSTPLWTEETLNENPRLANR